MMIKAKTGVLRTKAYRAKFVDTYATCAVCKQKTEIIEHLI